MSLNVEAVRRCLKEFDFRTLFVQELGWDRHSANLTVAVDSKTYELHALAEKRGFQVFECPPGISGTVPDHPTRSKIERQVAKSAHEHIIIYTDAGKTVQKWQWVRRELGRPLARREYAFFKGHTGELLAQKLQYLAVDLAEEERITLVDVNRRARQAFDVDRVTRRFYDRFQTEHKTFLKFIKGITAVADSEWYASLMLNRLMFIYFIQKKGFLDGDNDYLRNRLRRIQAERGKDKFLTFYRYFLLRLFHEGLGQPLAARKKDLDNLLGNVPYLNGGLFDVHDLERAYIDIQIADKAFERLFAFFDAYHWHLDERPLRADNEINPDVLGYIFEKYINQKQMGAYYTKEDITGYISRNTLIPFLFNAAEKKCAIAFTPDSALWRLLRDDPDRYIYPAMRKGVDLPLPEEIAGGLGDVSKRGNWNKSASEEHALPTETWREHVARRQRCHDLRSKLKAGEVHDINDFITYNLDICQLAEDVIDNSEGPELLRAFYHALENVSVLDPTCGSGAFLFAALNLLEPLYEACLERMHGFLDDLTRDGAKHHPEKFSDFRKVLENAERHPNRRYFILKSIIVGNLYGVDIMEEAVEICKLRLFLKLVAQVEKVEQIEPLPDIDFNVRAGNTLVGFAELSDVQNILRGRFNFKPQVVERILADAQRADQDFRLFRRLQTEYGKDAIDFSEAKASLRRRLEALRDQLDHYLAGEYDVDPNDEAAYQRWHESHQPFHWFAEFYGIMSGGGFDVIIGNPPYIEYSKVRRVYQVHNCQVLSCGNLYALCTERSYALLNCGSRFGFIVQAPIASTSRMESVRGLLRGNSDNLSYATFDDRPAKLFNGMNHCRVAIVLARKTGYSQGAQVATTQYYKWYDVERSSLFDCLSYLPLEKPDSYPDKIIPKFRAPLEETVFRKVASQPYQLGELISASSSVHRIYYKITGVGHWFAFTTRPPRFWRDGVEGSSTREQSVAFRTAIIRDTAFCCLWSTLHYWLYQARTNCRDFNPSDLHFLPLPQSVINGLPDCGSLSKRLMKCLEDNALVGSGNYEVGGAVRYERFQPKLAKSIIDEIDRMLSKHYGFTDEELDFIINYDIKYRTGQDGGAEEE
ncbi:MAG TPA: DNA methyltransferase [Gemmataceae bacterium]|jgi:hypothetical protein